MRHPWTEWLDGREHTIRPGVDFNGRAGNMRLFLRQRAEKEGLDVATANDGTGGVRFQFLPRGAEKPAWAAARGQRAGRPTPAAPVSLRASAPAPRTPRPEGGYSVGDYVTILRHTTRKYEGELGRIQAFSKGIDCIYAVVLLGPHGAPLVRLDDLELDYDAMQERGRDADRG